MSPKITSSQRRYDLDWLRVLAILAVFVFHSGRFFDQMGWHVKSATVYAPVQAWTLFLVGWLMPLIFVISGASLFYAVGKGSVVQFIQDKVLRLLVPLVVGVFTHASLAVYLERTTNGQFSGSFFEFYPRYFNGMYGLGGNFAWMGLHLWYLLVLFVFSLAFLPLFYLLKGPARSLLDKLGDVLAVPGVILVLILPVAWLSAILDPRTGLGQRNFGGWPVPIYICYLLYGFILFSHARLQARILQMRWFYLVAALATAAVLLFQFGYAFPRAETKAQLYFGLFFITSSWCWILAFIGFTSKYLTSNTRLLKYANEAVLPFYIMHQTVLLVIGYFVLQWPIPAPIKWLLIALSSFVLVVGIYELLVRRFNALRVLFGMKPMAKQPAVRVPEPVTAQ
ncbi:MAG: acyltransferase [Thermodesulfobacteriota bacterium]|jgi:peptidoglycan/LPS O-acetylase OafA/YrhL